MVKERTEVEKETTEEVKEKEEKEEVEFIPTNEEAKQLYGETSKPKKKVKHTYRNASLR